MNKQAVHSLEGTSTVHIAPKYALEKFAKKGDLSLEAKLLRGANR